MDNQKICHLMSKGENIVYCNENCAWRLNVEYSSKCAVPQIVEALDYNTRNINDGVRVLIDRD